MIFSWMNNLCTRLPGVTAGEPAGGPQGLRKVCRARAPQHHPELRPAHARQTDKLQSWARLALTPLVLLAMTLAAPSQAAEQGDQIINNAWISGDQLPPVITSVSVSVAVPRPSKLEFLKYAPLLAGATLENVATTYYRTGADPAASFAALSAPVPAGTSTPIDLSQPVPLTATDIFHQCEPIFVRLSAPDQNLNRTQVETALVSLTDSVTGNLEVLRLTETGPDTGVFTGYLQSTGQSCGVSVNPPSYSGVLPVTDSSTIIGTFRNVYNSNYSSSTLAVVDPFGIIFDSRTGKPLSGVGVTLINTATGNPAAVLGDDGVSSYPSTVVSGGTTTDSSNRRYDFPPGGFRFPFVAPGSYRFQVTPTVGYQSPTTVSNATLQSLPGSPFAVTIGSRLEEFVINPGPAMHVDIPLDPILAVLWLQKTAGKDTAAIGDFVPYQLDLQNTQISAPAAAVVIVDTLPPGFRYRKGSTRVNNLGAPDPTFSADGRTMSFALGDLPAKSAITVRYVVEVAAGAKLGAAVNQAQASSATSDSSNLARATVQVRSDFLNSRSVLMGQVIAGACGAPDASNAAGLPGARIYLEDGTFVDTDKRGMFHFEGIKPGSHVVQLDLDSLPDNYTVIPCEENTRFAGRAYSQFVDVQGGSMWRTDFHVSRKMKLKESTIPAPAAGSSPAAPAPKGELSLEMKLSLHDNVLEYLLLVTGKDVAAPSEPRISVTLPSEASYLAGSSQLDDAPLADPTVAGRELSFPFTAQTGDWQKEIRFRATLPRDSKTEEFQSKASLIRTGQGAGESAGTSAEHVAHLVREDNHHSMPEFVLHPQFPTFGADLSDEDRSNLDELARLLLVLNTQQISVTGHTDKVRIAQRSRGIYEDNNALSLARAKSVGRYLIEKLHLPPSKLEIAGMGAGAPVADNRSKEGRALNRRVEVRVKTERVVSSNRLEVLKSEPVQLQAAVASQPVAPSAPPAASAAPATPVAPVAEENDGRVREKPGILDPADKAIMAQPVQAVRVCLPDDLLPRLVLDGKEISSERIGFSAKDKKTGKALYTYIGVNFGKEGEHVLQLQGMDPFGNARFDQSVQIHRSGDIASLRLVSADGNTADGKTPVRMRLEALDASGQVLHSAFNLEIRSGTLKPFKEASALPPLPGDPVEVLKVDKDGIALFQPVNTSGPYRVTLGFGTATLDVETYIKPLLRDWILVGLGEGTAGYNTASGHMENLRASGTEDSFYDDGRLAFFAKGQIKGEWLLTMSFDSAKSRSGGANSLFQTIDPNTYYTLYGDASQQQYDAASQRKLYIKIERNQFYALFGDFDTNLSVTELSRYSRRMNGLKSEYQGKNLEANVFGSPTAQAYARDEIRGDGTSGLYRLSRKNIVLNSEKITVETRDRFRSEIIKSSVVLSRFSDYSIDYEAGTLFFKAPIHNRDEDFNPIYIVTEYETLDAGTESLTFGGRVGAKLLDNKLKAGVTYIHEGQVSGEGNSYGVDASYKLTPQTTLKAEAARTNTSFGATDREGTAWLAELNHQSARLQGNVYFRLQEAGFGLGQQNGSETGTRKAGVDAAYKLSDLFGLSGQAYRQYNLSTGAVQDMVEAKSLYTSGPYTAHLGLRHAADNLGDGSTHTSEQLTMGASWLTLNKKLTLKLDRDQSIGGNANDSFPTRTALGAEYKLTEKNSVFVQQEITSGESAHTNTTRAGIKSTPWTGSQINTSMEQNRTENGDRLFALFGLKQTWKLSDKWSVDAGLDRSQTVKETRNYTFNVNVPPASGENTNFTAVSLGTTYKEQKWNWDSRIEVRRASAENKWGFLSSYSGEPKEGWGWSARLQLFDTTSITGTTNLASDLRLGLVYRPLFTRWIILDRLDILYNEQRGDTIGTAFNTDNRRIVNNLSANFRPNKRSQLSLQYGAKYALETIDTQNYSSYTDLMGLEGIYDFTKDWDLGLRGSMLHSWSSGQVSSSAGLSVGYSMLQNVWLSLGYNFTGFTDKDFSAASYTAQGPYFRFRFKFDQNSVKEAIQQMSFL
jgi:uncharacterized repeat protein (TIGR01451 family)